MNTNYKFGEIIKFDDVISYSDERVAFENIFETNYGGVSVLAMKAGQKLDTHTAPFEVMVTMCAGEVDFTMLDMTHNLKAGEFLLMGANVPHSVIAKQDSIITLVKIKN